MKTQTSIRGAILVCLLLSCVACTPQKTRPLEVRAVEPVTIIQREYIPLSDNLLRPIESAHDFSQVWRNGDMYNALAHDARWLDTCKAQVDGIRVLYEEQAKTKSTVKP